MNKTCFKCLQCLPYSHFYKHSKMSDGYMGKCKKCTKLDVTKNRELNLDYYRKYDRKRADLPKRVKLRASIAEKWKNDPDLKKRMLKHKKNWSEKNTIKRAAHIITGNAIRDGRLILGLCEVCKKKKVDAHYDDYTKPLEVRWLCRKHHAELHKEKRKAELAPPS